MFIDDKGRKWYKANLHTHTTESDALKSREESARIFKAAGYDILAFTDHWVVSDTYMDGEMLMLRGCEYHTFTRQMSHIVGVGMKDIPDIVREEDPQSIVDKINISGGAAILAHPAWSLNPPQYIAELKGIAGAEIYNSVSDYPYSARGYSGNIMDIASALLKKCIPAIAADDCHYYNGDELRGWTYLMMDELTEDNVIKALKNGDFFATQGPIAFIERVEREDGSYACVTCSDDAEAVQFFSASYWNRDTTKVFKSGEERKAYFKIKPNDVFIRAEVRAKGKLAWVYLK